MQLVLFHLSSFLLMWLLYQSAVAIVVNGILGLFLIFFFLNGSDLFEKLYISDEESTDTNMNQRASQVSVLSKSFNNPSLQDQKTPNKPVVREV